MHADEVLISAPMRATVVKRAYGSGPVTTCCCRPGAGLTILLGLPRRCPGLPPRLRSQAGAPAAAQRRGRASLTPASGGRSSRARKGPVADLLMRGRVRVPGAWLAEWSHKH